MVRAFGIGTILLLAYVVCNGQYVRNGTVTNSEKRPLSLVTITVIFDNNNDNNKVDNDPHTDDEGSFYIKFHNGIDLNQNITLIFHKEGCKDVHRSVTINDRIPLNIILLPEDKHEDPKRTLVKSSHLNKSKQPIIEQKSLQNDFSAVNKISQGLLSKDSTSRYYALIALTTISQSARRSLNTVLHILMDDESQKNRIAAANFLVELNYNAKDVEQAFIYSLSNVKNTELRVISAYGLKMIVPLSPEGFNSLIYSLKDPELRVTINALYTLNQNIKKLPAKIDQRVFEILAKGINMSKDTVYLRRCYHLIAMYSKYDPGLWDLWINKLRQNNELAFEELENVSVRDSLVIRAIKLEGDNYQTSKRMSIYNNYLRKYTPRDPIGLLIMAYNDKFFYYNKYPNHTGYLSPLQIVVDQPDSTNLDHNDIGKDPLVSEAVDFDDTDTNSVMVRKLKGLFDKDHKNMIDYIKKSPKDVWPLGVAYRCDTNAMKFISQPLFDSFNQLDTIKWDLSLSFLVSIREKANFMVLKLPDILDSLYNNSELPHEIQSNLLEYVMHLINNCHRYLPPLVPYFEQKYLRYGMRSYFSSAEVYWAVVIGTINTGTPSQRLFNNLLGNCDGIDFHLHFIARHLSLIQMPSDKLLSLKKYMLENRKFFSELYPKDTKAILAFLGADSQ